MFKNFGKWFKNEINEGKNKNKYMKKKHLRKQKTNESADK